MKCNNRHHRNKKTASCLGQMLCVSTRASAAATFVLNDTHPLSAGHQAPFWRGCSERNVLPFTSTQSTGTLYLLELHSRLMEHFPSGYTNSGCCSLSLPLSLNQSPWQFLAVGVVLCLCLCCSSTPSPQVHGIPLPSIEFSLRFSNSPLRVNFLHFFFFLLLIPSLVQYITPYSSILEFILFLELFTQCRVNLISIK